MSDAEAAIEMLKALGAPKGDDGNASAGLMDMIEKMRVEFREKVKQHDFNMNAKIDLVKDDLAKRIEALIETDKKQ